jgi:hypothetical protein
MRGFLSTALMIFMTGLICLQSVTPSCHTGMPESICFNFAEETGGDEDTDEREDIDKSLSRGTGVCRSETHPVFHFTGYLKLQAYPDFEVVFPPPKS